MVYMKTAGEQPGSLARGTTLGGGLMFQQGAPPAAGMDSTTRVGVMLGMRHRF
ncbi:hypothetical protein LJR296_005404 [Cupriavidus necator]|uniref:hypothetical protein n=1 Tax=Cupriavidus necator TaxID=106590 RepID=UPI003ECED69A